MDLSPLDKAIPSWDAPTLQGFDLNNVQDGQRIKGSARQYVRFYPKTFLEVYATKVKINDKTGTTTVLETGTREVTKEMVNIITPGDKNEVDDVACDFHRREHWAEYKAFREGRTAPIGTPLDDVNFISPHVATELRYHGCHTVEQLADGSDLLCNQIANGFALREFARALCKVNADNKSLGRVNALQVELDKANATIANMQKQLAVLFDARGNLVAPAAPVSASSQLEVLGTPPVTEKRRTRRTKAQIAAENAEGE